MATYTDNLNLAKPLQEEYYDVDVFNGNADILDEAIKDLQDIKADKSTVQANNESCVHINGAETINGEKTFNSDPNLNYGVNFNCGKIYSADKQLVLLGSKVWGEGSVLRLFNKDNSTDGGTFDITAVDKNGNTSELIGTASGELWWHGKNIVRSVNGNNADTSGNVSIFNVPVGMICYYAKNATPSGFLYCNGSAVSRTTYKALFDVIGTTFGTGDGSTTFNLPNLVDKTVWGGTGVGTVKSAGLPNITARVALEMGNMNYKPNGAFYFGGDTANTGGGAGGNTDGILVFDASRSNSIYGKSSTVQPPALVLVPLIKY